MIPGLHWLRSVPLLGRLSMHERNQPYKSASQANGLLSFEQQYSAVAEVEVDEVFRL